MQIKELELNNFRIYKGVNKIELLPTGERNIAVISGKNGFGKTTFLMSLVWCLYGRQMDKVDELYRKEIGEQGSYNNYIANSLNRLAREEGHREFSVSITFKNVEIPAVTCDEVKITRSFKEQGAKEEVRILIDGRPNELIEDLSTDNQSGEEIFIRDFILPLEIAKFFFFDAEKIVSLAEISSPDQRKQLSRAYSEVLGIHKYEELKENLEKLQDEYRKESAKPKDRQEFNEVITQISNNKIELQECDDRITEERDKKTALKFQSDEIQRKLIQDGNKMTLEELEDLKRQEEILVGKIQHLEGELKESFDLVPFALAGNVLLNISSQVEKEEQFRNNSFKQNEVEEKTYEVLNDLEAERQKSTINFDSRVHEFYSSQIKSLIHKHFYPDVAHSDGVFEVLHDFSGSQRNEFNSMINDLKSTFKQKFELINREHTESKNQWNEIRKKIFNAEKDQENDYISGLRKEKHRLDREIEVCESKIEEFIRKIERIKEGQKQAEKRRTELHDRIKVSDKNKAKDDKAKELIKELNVFMLEFKKKKKKSLEQHMLQGMNTLMHKKGFIKKVVVDISLAGDDVDINLYDKRDKKIDKETLSMGEKQMYASALLSALVEESEIDFPVFIDSPMQKFDEEHAERIIKNFYPTISDQVILFPLINKELTEKEYGMLLKNVSKAYIIQNEVDRSGFLSVEPKDLIKEYNLLYNAN